MTRYNTLIETPKESTKVFEGKMLHAYSDEVILPDGEIGTREYVRHIGAVAIVPITKDGKVIMERQFRYPVNEVILEIPAGKIDSKTEDRLEAAKRELREETGIIADTWTEIGIYKSAPAYSDEEIRLYIAEDLHKTEKSLDDDEFLLTEKIDLAELCEMVLDGRITDGKTQVAIMKAAIIRGVV